MREMMSEILTDEALDKFFDRNGDDEGQGLDSYYKKAVRDGYYLARGLIADACAAGMPEPSRAKDEEIAELRKALDSYAQINQLLTHKIITCGVAASHSDAGLSRRGAYAGKWNSPQAEEVRALRDKYDALIAAAPTESK